MTRLHGSNVLSSGDQVGKQTVGFDPNNKSRRQHDVVAPLQANEIAARAQPSIRSLVEIERAVERPRMRVQRSRREVRTAPGVARLTADVETAPVEGVRRCWSRRVRYRLRELGAARHKTRRERKQRCTPHKQPAHDCPQPRLGSERLYRASKLLRLKPMPCRFWPTGAFLPQPRSWSAHSLRRLIDVMAPE